MSGSWEWAAVVGLGAFHGVNPAMGWLFAVALGLQEGERGAVLRSLPPIALGHAASVALILFAFGAAQLALDPRLLRLAVAGALVAFGLYRLLCGYRHRVRVGMRVGFVGLAFWSFLMASAHGAGLMVAPVLLSVLGAPDMAAAGSGDHAHLAATALDSLTGGILLLILHMAAMMATIAAVALVVFEKVGLAILRRGWINLDFIWAGALTGTGLMLALV